MLDECWGELEGFEDLLLEEIGRWRVVDEMMDENNHLRQLKVLEEFQLLWVLNRMQVDEEIVANLTERLEVFLNNAGKPVHHTLSSQKEIQRIQTFFFAVVDDQNDFHPQLVRCCEIIQQNRHEMSGDASDTLLPFSIELFLNNSEQYREFIMESRCGAVDKIIYSTLRRLQTKIQRFEDLLQHFLLRFFVVIKCVISFYYAEFDSIGNTTNSIHYKKKLRNYQNLNF